MALFRRTKPAETIKVLAAADRFETVTEHATSRHCFSAGAHYDPDNVGYGPLIGLDEHAVAPGAGFDWHAHRGVEILSWVLDGVLRHEDDGGRVEEVGAGELLHQSTGSGLRHRETNPSASEPLRFVQLTVLGRPGTPRCERAGTPLLVAGAGLFDVLPGKTILELGSALVFVTRGSFNVTGRVLGPGDSVRLSRTLQLSGDGEALIWSAGGHQPPAAAKES